MSAASGLLDLPDPAGRENAVDRKVHGFESDRSHVTKLPRNDHWAQLRRTLLWWGLGLGISVLLMLAVLLGWL